MWTNEQVALMQEDWLEYGCQACKFALDEYGPLQGPVVKYERFRVDRWGMSPAEWAGGWL